MSFIKTTDNITIITNAFKNNQIDEISAIIRTPAIYNILNVDVVWDSSRNIFIENCIKNTNMSVAEIIIDNIHKQEIKQYTIEYIIALFFKYNKYETALCMMSKYNCNIANIFHHMQRLYIDNDILKNFFSKHYDKINDTEITRKWAMINIGHYNNIDLLLHFQKYFEINDDDIYNILFGTIHKHNKTCFNTIIFIFENYNFDYDVELFISIIKELFSIEYEEPIYYILVKLFKKSNGDAISDIINYLEYEDNYYLAESLIKHITTAFNNYILFDEYIKLFSLIKSKELFNFVKNTLNLSFEELMKIKNMIGPHHIVFHWF